MHLLSPYLTINENYAHAYHVETRQQKCATCTPASYVYVLSCKADKSIAAIQRDILAQWVEHLQVSLLDTLFASHTTQWFLKPVSFLHCVRHTVRRVYSLEQSLTTFKQCSKTPYKQGACLITDSPLTSQQSIIVLVPARNQSTIKLMKRNYSQIPSFEPAPWSLPFWPGSRSALFDWFWGPTCTLTMLLIG